MLNRTHILQVVWVLVAASLLIGAGLLQRPLDAENAKYRINVEEVAENHPAKLLLTMAPGGFRAAIVTYLWMRSEDLKNRGRYYEMKQLADLVCRFQPRFSGVWVYHSWNLAWNISVMAHTPEERWRWVNSGVELLRDQGIPQNRRSLILYQQLGWIYYSKMGQSMDDMHMAYKQRVAAKMQRLLGASPFETTEEAIDAFRPVAEAPLDKDLRKQGRDMIQAEQLAVLLSDPEVAAYVDSLKALGVNVGVEMQNAYNRFSMDDVVAMVRVGPPKIESERDADISALINRQENQAAQKKLLAFIRAQLLWNKHKMDPAWMLGLMEKYGPLDWRSVYAHALYWTTYGLHICKDRDLADIDSLNTDRVVLFCLKTLAWQGRMHYRENPQEPDWPKVRWSADWRFIDPANKEYILMAKASAEAEEREFARNAYRSGHVNFLIQATQMLYAGYRRDKAQELLDWMRENYNLSGNPYDYELTEFVVETLNKEGRPIPDRAYSQITASVIASMIQLTRDNSDGFRSSLSYARRVYNIYQEDIPTRNRLRPFPVLLSGILGGLLTQPALYAVNMPLLDRSVLYSRMSDDMQRMTYDGIAPRLRFQCDRENIDFDKAFPAPPGMEEYRARQMAPR